MVGRRDQGRLDECAGGGGVCLITAGNESR